VKELGLGRCFRALSLGAMVALGAPAALPPEKQKWYEGRSAHFLFVTDGTEKETLARARSFEILHEILRIISPDLRRGRAQTGPKLPSFVYLFSSAEEFQSYSAMTGIDGYFAAHLDGNYIAMDSSTERSTDIAYHEYLHQYMKANFPAVPLWLNEGMACFFQTMQLDGQEIVLGRPPEGYLHSLATQGILPVARILAVSHQSPEYTAVPERRKFYASAWLLIDYLMTGGDVKRAQLGQYLDLIRSGHPPEACFRLAFDRGPELLDQELRGYLRLLEQRKTISIWTIQFKTLQADPSFAFTGLPRSEALGRLGLLLMSDDEAFRERSKAHLSAALSLDPHGYAGNLGMGILAMLDGRLSEAAPYFGNASLSHPDDAQLHFFAGACFYTRSCAKPGDLDASSGEADLDSARTHLIRALEQGYPDPQAVTLLSSALGRTPRLSTEDSAALERLCKLLPSRFELMLELAKLRERSSGKDSARALFREVAEQTTDPRSAALARSQLGAMDHAEADRLYRSGVEAFRQKRYAEAVAALEEAIRITPDAARKRDYQENLDNMKILIELRSKAVAKPLPAGKR